MYDDVLYHMKLSDDGDAMLNANAFNDHLMPGEAMIWSDRPAQGILLAPRDTFLIPFSLLWGGFAIFWEMTALSSEDPMPFALFGVPFVLIGMFLIIGRFLLDAWLRTKIVYALTDRRILILRRGFWPSFDAMSLDRLPEAGLRERANGRGTIRFGAQAPLWVSQRAGFGSWIASLDPTPQFLDIADARRVFAALQQRSHRT